MQTRALTPGIAVRWWRVDDPGLAGLRRAARTALVMPPAFAFALLVIRDVQLTTFVAFGCFAFLVMADFGGRRLRRAGAYLSVALAGSVLIALGTAASTVPALAVLATFVVAFCVQLVGVFGGYAAGAQPALLLSFVLAVSIPAPPGAVGPRLAGWLIAGAVSTLAAVLLWPRFEQMTLYQDAAAACRALADLLWALRENPDGAGLSARREAARRAVEMVRQRYAATAKRPAGPTRRHRALVELVTELERMLELIEGPFNRRLFVDRPCIEEGDKLAAEVVRTLRASADVLTGGAPPDLLALLRARTAHREALDRWAADALRAGRSPEAVLAGLEVDHALRAVSYVALALGSNAVVAAGGQPDAGVRLPPGTPREGASRVVVRIARTIRDRLVPTSSVLHNSLRAGAGLALAVLAARLLRLDHAFWVVLGTVSVLRTNALATGRTTVQALAGTMVGFGLAGLFTAVAGTSTTNLWAVLPVVVFLAAYASSAIGFVVGQAAFTINVLVLFNLITPVGWRLGLARVEDVAIGAGISLVVGLLLWPRGARSQLARALADLYRAVVAYLTDSLRRVLEGRPRDARRARQLAGAARGRAEEAFEQYLNERGAKPARPEAGASLLASASHVILVGDFLNQVADLGYRADGCAEGARVVRERLRLALAYLARLADLLEGAAPGLEAPADGTETALREAALACLRRWREDPAVGRSAVAVAAAAEWVEQLTRYAADLREPAERVARSARVSWWR